MEAVQLKFEIPEIHDNPIGWGPSDADLPKEFADGRPFAYFDKSGSKLGKICDWSAPTQYQASRGGRFQVPTEASKLEKEEDSFQVVSKEIKNKPSGSSGTRKPFQQQQRGPKPTTTGGRQQNRRPGQGFMDKNLAARLPSVDVKPDWRHVRDFTFAALGKEMVREVPAATDLAQCGVVESFDRSFDRVVVKNEVPLKKFEDTKFLNVTTVEDPVLREYAKTERGNVFATDAILATLMASPKSVFSWDLVLTRAGSTLIVDKRDVPAGSSSRDPGVDLLTVGETMAEPPSAEDGINSASMLAQEATYINHCFSQQALSKSEEGIDLGEANPFKSTPSEPVASTGYRYRKWVVSEKVTLVARTEVNAVVHTKDSSDYQFALVRAVNEYDPKLTDFRTKADSSRGGIVASELKNNACKFSKWTAQAHLSGAEQLKLGFVSRSNPRDRTSHTVLGVHTVKVADIPKVVSFNNMWGILKAVFEFCLTLDEGKYVLIKDPIKPTLSIYEVDDDSLEEEVDAEEEESPSMRPVAAGPVAVPDIIETETGEVIKL